jgi:IPT/TIG domain
MSEWTNRTDGLFLSDMQNLRFEPRMRGVPVAIYLRHRFHVLCSTIALFGMAPFLGACGGGSSSSSPPPNPSSLTFSASPSSLTLVPNSTVTLTVTAVASNTSGTPSVTSIQAPIGITTTTPLPLSVPPSGASLTLQISASAVAGTLILNGQAGSTSGSGQVPITIQASNSPNFSFGKGYIFELQVPIGGSGQIQLPTDSNNQAEYNVVLSISNLPTGVTATLTPSTIFPGEPVTVALTASSTAPLAQNVPVTVTGTPQPNGVAGSTIIIVDVTLPSASLPDNRTDYLSTGGTPYAGAYDPVHNLVFVSNPSWNRVDVISNSTHAVTQKIDIPAPRGIDISQDSSTVWVSTNSQQIFAINTSTFAATRYVLPNFTPPSGSTAWVGSQLVSLADGSIMMMITASPGSGIYSLIDWNPSSGTLTQLTVPSFEPLADLGPLLRSGDGTQVWFVGSTSDEPVFHYDVLAQTFSGVTNLAGYALDAAVNYDGSRIAIFDSSGLNMYDGNVNLIGPLAGGGVLAVGQFTGGMVFSPFNGDLYETAMPLNIPVTFTIDANSLNVVAVAPAMGMIPAGAELSPPFYMAAPFAVDSTGMVFGIQDYGVAFDDAAFSQNFLTIQLGPCIYMGHLLPDVGPIAGGTTSGASGCSFPPITPAVWYGANRGTATNTVTPGEVGSYGQLTAISPPGNPGPVNLKFLFPDGTQIFDPQSFSYGPFIRYAALSGASPDGGAAGMIDGYGMPSGGAGGTITIGGSAVTNATSPAGFTSPFPSTALGFTVPAGNPGWSDITVSTPNGTSTLPNAFFYAASVTDYPSSDTFTAILYDSSRQQLYLSAGDHIDVFSLTSNQFVSPLALPAQGASKQFVGLALTPDYSQLIAADLVDGSLAVVNPDSPSMSYVVPVAAPAPGNPGCTVVGPLYVASAIDNQAFVTTGSLPPSGCTTGGVGPYLGGDAYVVNLTSRTATLDTCCQDAYSVASSADGTEIVIPSGLTLYVYNVAQQSLFSTGAAYEEGSATISGDGNVVAQQTVFANLTANVIGQIAGSPTPSIDPYPDGLNLTPLADAQLNQSGSLYFIPSTNTFDIDDVQHGRLRLRFSLSETISNTAVPLAVDSGGRHIYLLTNKGLTIVDLGEALLSIGSLNPATASPGTSITVRGSGFNSSTTATVGGQAASVSFTDENTLTLTVPSVSSGPTAIVLQNSDGSSYTLQNGLTIP